jgi:hypothetical protein
MPTSSIARPFKIYPNWDFWFENMPSGNPAGERLCKTHRQRVEEKEVLSRLKKSLA